MKEKCKEKGRIIEYLEGISKGGYICIILAIFITLALALNACCTRSYWTEKFSDDYFVQSDDNGKLYLLGSDGKGDIEKGLFGKYKLKKDDEVEIRIHRKENEPSNERSLGSFVVVYVSIWASCAICLGVWLEGRDKYPGKVLLVVMKIYCILLIILSLLSITLII